MNKYYLVLIKTGRFWTWFRRVTGLYYFYIFEANVAIPDYMETLGEIYANNYEEACDSFEKLIRKHCGRWATIIN